jgi:hypothetical protein
MVKIFQNVVQGTFISAVTDTVVTPDTLIYKYPFTNVSGIGSVCYGGNNISQIDITSLTALHSIPNMFLAMPNTEHHYRTIPNISGLEIRPLFEQLKDKPFPENWLAPMHEKIDYDYKKDEFIQMTFAKWLEYFK